MSRESDDIPPSIGNSRRRRVKMMNVLFTIGKLTMRNVEHDTPLRGSMAAYVDSHANTSANGLSILHSNVLV